MRKILWASLLLLCLSLPQAAKADDEIPQDQILLDLRAEESLYTANPLVIISITAAGGAQSSGNVRADMQKNLESLAKDAEWKLTSLSRSQDDAGLERWYATYQGRLPESVTASLREKAKQQSKAGLQINVSDVQFVPTLQEVEAAKARLREKLYKMANDELTRLNASLPNRNFRIAAVNFSSNASLQPIQMMKMARMAQADMAMAQSAPAPEMSVENKIEQSASVILSSFAPIPK